MSNAQSTFTAAVTPDGDAYVDQCRELDVASEGPTIEAALSNLQEALELYFEDEMRRELRVRL